MTPGTKLGPYEIVAPLGKGGMGEVYRARDTKLNREVAIKVLPEAFAGDPERMARFEREARVLASLNHPNIATIHGVEDRALVMELVEGESPKGPLPFDEAWKIALQIADALEYAHEKGVIHRDLKPANVKVTPDGAVKLLDFGLAKAFSGAPEAAGADPSNSPTITLGATVAGTIMGTAAYMAPEQARGKQVDKRADIWSWGVVLYELLSGERLFQGEDAAETLAAVIHKQPDLERVPPQVRKLLQRCLEKDPKKRLRHIGDAWELLEDGRAQGQADAPPQAVILPQKRAWLWPALTAFAVLLAAAAGWIAWRASRPSDRRLVRLNLDLAGWTPAREHHTFALSPDGTRIVYRRQGAGGVPMLATRLLEEPESHILPGTENASEPFFSPDGQWIGFGANGQLQKISIRGGAPVTLATAPSLFGASWGNDGFIAAVLSTGVPLSRVPETGGTPQEIMKPAEAGGATSLQDPQYLPGDKAVLLEATGLSATGVYVKNLDSGQTRRLIDNATFARYLPTGGSTGHIVYLEQGTLFAVPFDPAKLAVLGPPQPVLSNVAGDISFSETGEVLYRIGQPGAQAWPVDWMDSSGAMRPLLTTPGPYTLPEFSPDPAGRFLELVKGTEGIGDVLVYDWQHDVTVDLTRPGGQNGDPVWSPDGKHIAMSVSGNTIEWVRSDGSGEAHRILAEKNRTRPTSISPDGRYIAFSEQSPATRLDVWVAPLDLSNPDRPVVGKPQVFANSPGNDFGAVFSPDGKWLAYFSDQSGSYQVYVQPFPGPGASRNVSVNGGIYPDWSRDGRQLFFESLDGFIQVMDYHVTGQAFLADRPRKWSDGRYRSVGVNRTWDLAPDGKRIAMFPPDTAGTAGGAHFGFLLNFFDELRRLAPPKK